MCDSVGVVVALVAALPPKRLDLPSLPDRLLSLPKQIGGVHGDSCTFLGEYGSMDLDISWTRWLHHRQDVGRS